jgi:hypothetical protein
MLKLLSLLVFSPSNIKNYNLLSTYKSNLLRIISSATARLYTVSVSPLYNIIDLSNSDGQSLSIILYCSPSYHTSLAIFTLINSLYSPTLVLFTELTVILTTLSIFNAIIDSYSASSSLYSHYSTYYIITSWLSMVELVILSIVPSYSYPTVLPSLFPSSLFLTVI